MMSLTVSDLAMSFVRAFINVMSLLETIKAHLETSWPPHSAQVQTFF